MIGRVLRPYRAIAAVVALAATLVAALELIGGGSGRPREALADYVIIAGAPGLRWDDLSPTATPVLWQLVGEATVGALAVQSAARLTCPADGWLTLGAGNAAEWGIVRQPDPCGELPARVMRPDRSGGWVVEQPSVVEHNRKLAWGARPGALSESVRCTVAVGRGAALAAARPVGRVDRYLPALPDDFGRLFTECPLSIVDLGTVSGTGADRAAAVARVDAAAAKVLSARPNGSLLIVAGLADTESPSRLHVVLAQGPGFTGGWLESASTRRPGYVQLVDLAPTALSALADTGTGPPSTRQAHLGVFRGSAATRIDEGRPEDIAATVRALSGADQLARAQRNVSRRFLLALVPAQLLVALVAIPLLRRARASGPRGPRPVPPWWRRGVTVALTVSGMALPAALLVDVVPWWRTPAPGLLFAALWLVAVSAATAAVLAARARHARLGAACVGAGIAAVGVLVNLLSGGWLQLFGIGGSVDSGRFFGLGSVGLGVFIGGLLLAAGCLAQWAGQVWRVPTLVAAGCVGILVVGSPHLGADPVAAVALTAGFCTAVTMASAGWLTLTRLAVATGTGLAVTVALAALDRVRPVERRGALGNFIAGLSDGTAELALRRVSADNVVAIATSPLTVIALGAGLFVFFVLLRPWGGLKRLYGLFPPLRGVSVGIGVSSLASGLAAGAGMVVAGAAAATVLPLLTLTSMQALAHADERTVPTTSCDTTTGEPTGPSRVLL